MVTKEVLKIGWGPRCHKYPGLEPDMEKRVSMENLAKSK